MNAVPRFAPLRDRQEMKKAELAREWAELKAQAAIVRAQATEAVEKEKQLAEVAKLRAARDAKDEAFYLTLVGPLAVQAEQVRVYISYTAYGDYPWKAGAALYSGSDRYTPLELMTGTFGSLGDAVVWASNITRARKLKHAIIEVVTGTSVEPEDAEKPEFPAYTDAQGNEHQEY